MTEKLILPLAITPKGCTDITQWPPFEGGETLGKIVSQNNVLSAEARKRDGWLPEDIKLLSDTLDIVLHDLNDLDNVEQDRYSTIDIILADLDAVETNPQGMKNVRTRMGRARKSFYLLQKSSKATPQSLTEFFSSLPINRYPPPPPHLLSSEESLMEFLRRYSFVPPAPREDASLSPEGGGPDIAVSKDEYINAVSKVKEDVRHESIERDLSDEQTASLARSAIQQELAFTSIKRVLREFPQEFIVFDSIRKPVSEIALDPLQEFTFEPVELFGVRPSRSLWEISPQQRGILHQMGIKNESYTAVNANSLYTQDLLNSLGDCVKVNRFSANLPTFKFKI